MTIRVIKNDHEVEIQPIKYRTDTEFNDVIEPMPQKTFLMYLVGKPASGKSTTMSHLLTAKHGFYKKQFDYIYFVLPRNSLENLPKTHPYNKHIKAEPTSYYDKLNYDTLHEIMERCKKTALENEKSLLVIDDMASSLKNGDVVQLLLELANNRRHYSCSVAVLSQVFNTLPLSVRKSISHAFIWRCSPKEFDSIYEECFFNLTKEEAKELCNYCWKQDHGFVFIDLSENRYYGKGLNELVVE